MTRSSFFMREMVPVSGARGYSQPLEGLTTTDSAA